MPLLFACFLLSGFTGLLYQTVWLRMALADFGVNTAVVAAVLTVFMLGLALGAFLAGRWTEILEGRRGWRGLEVYALTEFAIGIGGLTVPWLFEKARLLLLSSGAADSTTYLAASTILLTAVLLPFCFAMGCTYPAAMAYMNRSPDSRKGHGSFSYLYLANVGGAVLGVMLTSFILIECLGFQKTLYIAACTNFFISFLAYASTRKTAGLAPDTQPENAENTAETADGTKPREIDIRLAALFLTGFCSMGMEVVWTRVYTPFVGTFVYSFAGILAVYLVSTTFGTMLYRRKIHASRSPWLIWFWLGPAAVISIAASAVQFQISGPMRIIIGISPFCAVLGYLTPFLIDDLAGGSVKRAGTAYAANLLGCVLGPVVAGFLLIPFFGMWISSFILIAPLFIFSVAVTQARKERRALEHAIAGVASFFLWLWILPYDRTVPKEFILYDHTATVIAGGKGMEKRLYVNGISITVLTPVTKMMVHFPMVHLDTQAVSQANGLVICLGMGTSFRSLMSWDIPATAVELVPSVPKFFSYFFPDAPQLLSDQAKSRRIIIDDGRRFLDRTDEMFDLISIDPPPPMEAAGSSLLYSKEFYRSAGRRLKPGGILQAWNPGGDTEANSAVAQSLLESFPYVRSFVSLEGWGVHFMASQSPIPRYTAKELTARMPAAAGRDMTEWYKNPLEDYFKAMLKMEIDPRELLIPGGISLTDDRPVNEFFFVRRYLLTRGGSMDKGI